METILSWFQSFLSVIKTFEVKDAIDIICVTAVIYAIIKFVRDTKAVQLLKGLVLFLVVYFISTLFNLTMFSTILKTFVEFGVIILIIVFQPELRSALEKLGRKNAIKEIKEYIEVPPNEDMGDYAFPCFKLAKTLRKSPPAIAAELKEKIDADKNIEKIEIVGGYLNFYINKKVLAKEVLEEIANQGESFGANNSGKDKTSLVSIILLI